MYYSKTSCPTTVTDTVSSVQFYVIIVNMTSKMRDLMVGLRMGLSRGVKEYTPGALFCISGEWRGVEH
jgi:hypothetical protein